MNDKKDTNLVKATTGVTLGLTFMKFLGLIYIIPLNMILQMYGDDPSTVLRFYSSAYVVFGYALSAATLGLPQAVSMLVARYNSDNNKNDTSIKAAKIFKLALQICFIIGIIVTSSLVILAPYISKIMINESSVSIDEYNYFIHNNTLSIRLISIALLATMLLSIVRGFFEGNKIIIISTISQIIEQITRIVVALLGSFIIMYFYQDPMLASHYILLSTTAASIFSLLYIIKEYYKKGFHVNQGILGPLAVKINKDEIKNLIREILVIAIPFVIFYVISNADHLINIMFSNRILIDVYGYEEGTIIYNTIITYIEKITSIPGVISLSLPITIIPYITANYAQNNMKEVRKNTSDIFKLIVFLSMPMMIAFYLFASPIYTFFFGYSELGTTMLKIYCSYGLLSSSITVCSNLLMSLKCRKIVIRLQLLALFLKTALLFGLTYSIGYPGIYLSVAIPTFLVIFIAFKQIKYITKGSYKALKKFIIRCFISGIMMFIATWLLQFGLSFIIDMPKGKMGSLLYLATVGGFSLIIYTICSFILYLPQEVFNLKGLKFKGIKK